MNRKTVFTALLAAVLLTIGLASGATAAKLLTGKDIKDGTIAVKDLSPQARTTFKYAHDDSTGIEIPACGDTALDDCPNLLSIPIVPGSQLVTFSGSVDNADADPASIANRCALWQGEQVLTEQRLALAGNTDPGEVMSFTLQQVVTVPDASLPVRVRCTEMTGEDLRLVEPRLTSVKLDKAP